MFAAVFGVISWECPLWNEVTWPIDAYIIILHRLQWAFAGELASNHLLYSLVTLYVPWCFYVICISLDHIKNQSKHKENMQTPQWKIWNILPEDKTQNFESNQCYPLCPNQKCASIMNSNSTLITVLIYLLTVWLIVLLLLTTFLKMAQKFCGRRLRRHMITTTFIWHGSIKLSQVLTWV